MKKLKDLKENECIKVNTLKEAKYLAKKIRFGISQKKVKPKVILNYEYVMLENGIFYHTAGGQTQLPASDFIKQNKSTKKIIKELTKRVDALEKIVVPDLLTASVVQAVHNADVVMKASQPEQEEEIDWSVAGQIVKGTYTTAITTGQHENSHFQGFVIKTTDGSKVNHLCSTLLKEYFSLVKGEIILKND